MSHSINDPEIARLEAALASLAPAPINRDVLMFRAGRASAPRGRFWPCAAAVLAVIATGLGAALAVRPGPQFFERVVFVPMPAPPPRVAEAPPPAPIRETPEDSVSASERARLSCFALQQQALRWGVEGLPTPRGFGPATAAAESPLPDVSSYHQMRLALKRGGQL
jgi:hypothetical protein